MLFAVTDVVVNGNNSVTQRHTPKAAPKKQIKLFLESLGPILHPK